MDVDIFTTDGAVDHIEKRLLEDWLIIEGDRSSIQRIEEMVYTPGTPDNADFEIIGFPHTIHLGRKNEAMKRLMGDSDRDGTVQFLILGTEMNGQIPVNAKAYNPAQLTKAEAAKKWAETAREYLTQRW